MAWPLLAEGLQLAAALHALEVQQLVVDHSSFIIFFIAKYLGALECRRVREPLSHRNLVAYKQNQKDDTFLYNVVNYPGR